MKAKDQSVPWTDLGLSYNEAMHGIQSAVAFEMEVEPDHSATNPKHLRVGVNASLVEHSALAEILMRKGIMTPEEYLEELRLAANHELDRYQQKHPGMHFR